LAVQLSSAKAQLISQNAAPQNRFLKIPCKSEFASMLYWIKHFIIATLLSALVFFAVSFLTMLDDLPFTHHYATDEAFHLTVGFPFQYYYEFMLRGSLTPNYEGSFVNLVWDCFLTWMVVGGSYVLFQRMKWRQKRARLSHRNFYKSH
jgi:hypothetical protein